jgi:hypothetical protein
MRRPLDDPRLIVRGDERPCPVHELDGRPDLLRVVDLATDVAGDELHLAHQQPRLHLRRLAKHRLLRR